MSKQSPSKKKKRKAYRQFSAEEKVTAVLSLWSERRTTAELGREMGLSYAVLQSWQNQALEAILNAFEPKNDEKCPKLHPKLAKLLAKKKATKAVPPQPDKLKNRLQEIQQK